MTLRPKKFLGQHFLNDENIARKIVDALNPDIPRVIEIGPGKGVLSKYLLEDPRFDPTFVEIDRESVAYLKQLYPAITHRLIEADFLKLDLVRLAQRSKSPSGDLGVPYSLQILGNFPYNISSQILFRVMEYRDLVAEVTGMFQKEVAQRIAAPPGSKTYGILSVLLQAFYTIEYLFTVNESVFTPPPKVKSAVIRLVRNEVQSLDCDEKFWVIVVKTAFNQRRKTLRNSVRKLVPPEFTQLNDPIFDLRPERLSVSDFVRLARMLHPESLEK
jgi:16S rRNA (adenine1518-N6/adenine1519-N6)-dimethyltransferase